MPAKNIIKSHEIKSTLNLALPLMAAFMSQKAMQFIDTMMMGWIGPAALAAGAIGTAVFITVFVFCLGTLSSVGVFVARAKGANDDADIKSSLQHGIWLALLLSIPSIFVIWNTPFILYRFENPEVVHNAALLLHGLVIGLPGSLLFLILREYISAFRFTRIIMIVTLCSIPLTFFLNYIFIYGKMGLPPLGVAGIGYAGAIVMWFMFCCLLMYTFLNDQLKSHLSFALFPMNVSKFRDMLYIGCPSGMFFLLESAMFFSATMMMGWFGVDTLASHQIAMQCAILFYSIPFALSMASAIQISHIMGANEIDRLKPIVIQNFILGFVISFIVAMCFILFPRYFINIFLDNSTNHLKTIQIATSFLFIAAFFQSFDAIQAIANGVLRGLKDTLTPMILSVGCYWIIGMGSSYFLAFHTSLGPKGIWYGITLGICSLGILLLWRLFQKMKFIFSLKDKKTISRLSS